MKLIPYCVKSMKELELALADFRSQCPPKHTSILAMVFTSDDRMATLQSITKRIHAAVPEAVVAGCTSSGEIFRGNLRLQTIIVSFLIFTSSKVETLLFDCNKLSKQKVGEVFLQKVLPMKDLRGIGFLLTSNTQGKLRDFLDQLAAIPKDIVIFGGAADTYANEASYVDTEQARVFDRKTASDKGILAILFRGEELNLFVSSHLGWKALSSEAVITEMKSHTDICTLNQEPTVETYKKYLGISSGKDFFSYAIPFLLMLHRDGRDIARVPTRCFPDGSMRFGADFDVGEKVRLGYGDPNAMFRAAKKSQGEMREFSPEGILLFSCIVRRMYLRDDVNQELSLCDALAPTAGFYTYGELERFSGHERVNSMNGASVAIGFREGKSYLRSIPLEDYEKARLEEPFDERISMVKVLANFISVMAEELEDANRKLAYLADIDRLTELLNRGAGEQILKRELKYLQATNGKFSAIMGDIDFFKKINDTYGHEKGDDVLRQVAKLLKSQVRVNDYVSRWGGEEFIILLPNCPIEKALELAERIRAKIESTIVLPNGQHVTMSFGVANAKQGDDMDRFYESLDRVLYESKANGRNRVTVTEHR